MSIVKHWMRGWMMAGLAIALGGVAMPTEVQAESEARMMAPTTQPAVENPVRVSLAENGVVSIRREGGFCMDPGCFSEVEIFADGTYRFSTHMTDPVTGQIGMAKVERLQRRIDRVEVGELYAQPLVAQPIDNFCGLAFDGPEVVYSLRRGDTVEEVRGCDFAIAPNHPLVRKLERLYGRLSVN